jgi:hypothetical protein
MGNSLNGERVAFRMRSADPEVAFVRNVEVTTDSVLNAGSKITRIAFIRMIRFMAAEQ